MNIDAKKLKEQIIKPIIENPKWVVIVSIGIIAICCLFDKDILIWIKNALSAIVITGGAALFIFIATSIWTNYHDKKLKEKEQVTGMFGFIIEDNLACVALKNIGENEVNFDFKKGVCLQWKNKEYYIINVMDDGMGSSIPPKAIRQFNCSARLFNGAEKERVNSPLKVFIYTTRGNGFYLSPTPSQLKRWENITIPQWEEAVKTIGDIPGVQTIREKETNEAEK